ncbi:hypothetical protein HX747_30780 [Streptomyces sp. L06]|nr:hypothetical protein [Streptomyces sp. L06]
MDILPLIAPAVGPTLAALITGAVALGVAKTTTRTTLRALHLSEVREVCEALLDVMAPDSADRPSEHKKPHVVRRMRRLTQGALREAAEHLVSVSEAHRRVKTGMRMKPWWYHLNLERLLRDVECDREHLREAEGQWGRGNPVPVHETEALDAWKALQRFYAAQDGGRSPSPEPVQAMLRKAGVDRAALFLLPRAEREALVEERARWKQSVAESLAEVEAAYAEFEYVMAKWCNGEALPRRRA